MKSFLTGLLVLSWKAIASSAGDMPDKPEVPMSGNADIAPASTLTDDEVTSLIKDKDSLFPGNLTKLDSSLGMIENAFLLYGEVTNGELRRLMQTDDSNKVLVDVTVTNPTPEDIETLKQDGFEIIATFKNVVSANIHLERLSEAADRDIVKGIRLSTYLANVGKIENEASQSMSADNARDNYSVDGTGLTIGVLSDSFDSLSGYSTDIGTGDLPTGVDVLADIANGSDEGRAMLQLIHDVAPGANLAFHSAFQGMAAFAQGILDLANDANCDVIVDDVVYFAEPFFQDGIVAQAVNEVVAQGVPYFSSMGNSAQNSWEGPFVSSGISSRYGLIHDFGRPGSTRQLISGFRNNERISFIFNWDEPSLAANGVVGTSSDLDIYFYTPGSSDPYAGSVAFNVQNGEPIETASFRVQGTAVEFEIVKWSGNAPGLMKWVILRGSQLTIDPSGNAAPYGAGFGHANAAGAAGIGAAVWTKTPGYDVSPAEKEVFSSKGGVPCLFDTNGSRLGNVEVRQQPRVVGPDGTSTTFFGTQNRYFYGTSAAAPNVAAIALLMLEANPDLSPDDVYSILEGTAEDMSAPGYDFDTGYGFVNAQNAISMAKPLSGDEDFDELECL